VDYEEKYKPLRESLLEVLTENPTYGYRRVEPELTARGHPVGETVVRRVLGMWDLSLGRQVTKPKPSVPRKLLQKKGAWNEPGGRNGCTKTAAGALHRLHGDSGWYGRGGKKAYFMPLLDHRTKWVIDWSVGHRPNTELALEALSMAQTTLEDVGLTLGERIIHHDQDTVYTSYRLLYAVLIKHRARISYSENGAKGNTTMESFFGRFKTENVSLFHEAVNISELGRVIAQQGNYYNRRRRHSTLRCLPPVDYIIQEGILPEPAFA